MRAKGRQKAQDTKIECVRNILDLHIYYNLGSSDLNQYLANCRRMCGTVFTGYSSWSKTAFLLF